MTDNLFLAKNFKGVLFEVSHMVKYNIISMKENIFHNSGYDSSNTMFTGLPT